MLALLMKINKNLILAIPVAMVLGFGFGLVAPVAWLKSLIVPLTFLMVYPMMVNLKLQKVLEGGDLKGGWGTRHRDGLWNGEAVTSEHAVSFTVFIVCTPAYPTCHLLRLSQLDNPLR